jgi:universal stress protein E
MRLLEKILVPVSLKTTSNEQIEMAKALAQKFGSIIHLLHILPDEARNDSINPLIMNYVERDINAIANGFEQLGITVDRTIRYGKIFERILDVSEEENVNLILLNNGLDYFATSFKIDVISEKLIRKAEKPVWVVKKGYFNIPQNMVCSVDFSEASERALNNAVKLARTFKAKLSVLNVFEPIESNFSTRYDIDYNEENQKLRDENSKMLKAFLKKINFSDVDFSVYQVEGKPNEQINDFVIANRCDLLFMGATGKNIIQRMFLGSVTEMVIRNLPCSMVITKTENILHIKMDYEISTIQNHFDRAIKLEESGFFNEAIDQMKLCLYINDLYIPALSALVRLYEKVGDKVQSEDSKRKLDKIFRHLWDKKIEEDIRRNLDLK